jgi:anti-sigma factor (TIGR02949 family)
MKHDCQDALGQLYQYLDAEVDEVTASRVKGHLDDCSGCFDSFDFERRLKTVIRDCLTEDMPEALELKVIALIREESG